jgi:phospholipid/cholesterol/gamma-HCH transport system substrate-binding protein
MCVVGAVAYLATRGTAYHYRFDFLDAGQLVGGDLVRIGGAQAGTVDAITLTPNGLAQVDVSIDPSFGPLREGTTAVIRSPGLSSVASRYIDVSPAPSFRPALPRDGVIPASQTAGIVDIDQLFSALNANTREGLRRLIRGFAAWYQGKSAQASLTSQYFPPALRAYAHFFSQLDSSTPALDRFISQTSRALGLVDQHAAALTDLVSQARVTALGSDNQSLSAALANLPTALRSGASTFEALRTQALPALTRLVNATRPVVGPLGPFLAHLQPVLNEATPTFALLRQVFDQPGPHNDLYDALLQLPALAGQIKGDFPRGIKALHESTPIFEFARPYIPDLVAWATNWAGIFAPYDANGHYARTVPVFDAFSFHDNPQGGTLTPKPWYDRGKGGALKTGFLYRCPGAGVIPPPDHSAPYHDTGSLSNPHCRPQETIGGHP